MNRNAKLLLSGLMLLLTLPFAAQADVPGAHPFYLHALTDLRGARWLLQHGPGDPALIGEEDAAIREIDAAIGAIKQASIDDGKDLRDHPQMDMPAQDRGRLRAARELLHKVHSDVAREEDDPVTRGLRNNAVVHIDAALRAMDLAIHYADTGH